MIDLLYILVGAIAAYLIGSFPTAIWYGRLYHDLDIRDYGSGNAGATNTFRVLGKKAGTIVMLIDVLKGWTATSCVFFLMYFNIISVKDVAVYKLIFGLCAVTGHIFPIYEHFKGGKGIATLLGMVLSIHIEAALICMAVFFVVLVLSKYVSLGSIISTLSFPLMLLFIPQFKHDEPPIVIIFGFAIFLMVVITHKKNIKRLFKGEENKTLLRLRKKH